MTHDDRERVLDYPLPRPAALEPPTEWAELHRRCPIARVKLPSGDEALLLTRYDDVKQVLSDPRFTRSLSADDAAQISDPEGGLFNNEMSEAMPDDAEGHQRWRRMVTKWFTTKRMRMLAPGI
ncbi:cytochrome P450, partial [Streptomyces sp. NPDC087850]